ncbi:hypothetical protein EMPS_02771 [Entomortierella parvispora]|uniref:Histidine phosphatase superfamily n=1 Tax=Entomortierella parvispora TaxID=205924 RepID=A0A9P3H5H9_9FUNG|nr:hypothetical protein EMPS_02771 [Entomortierella parvispora]
MVSATVSAISTSTPNAHECYSRTIESLQVKPCVAKGHRECSKGFLTDHCHKCTRGSISCNMCNSSSESSTASCIFCFDGYKECDDCFGIGYVQRICQDCVKAHYRSQQVTSPVSALPMAMNTIGSKVKSQISSLQRQPIYQNGAALLSSKSFSSYISSSTKRLSFSALSTKSSSSVLMPNISLYFVRHGQRIDQVDKSWAQSSPCPQDPPLTDLGKNQARQTGKIIRDFALESSSNLTCSNVFSTLTDPSSSSRSSTSWSVQKITPPESPDLADTLSSVQLDEPLETGASEPTSSRETRRRSGGNTRRPHHFAILTSPFLRCSQTAIEMAIGIRTESAASNSTTTSPSLGEAQEKPRQSLDKIDQACDRDLVTIAVESGLAEWLSMEYVAEPVPSSIIVQRMQEFAMARHEHTPFYTVDWKYQASERALPDWPEVHEDMQERLDRTLNHILRAYSAAALERDLSIIFVTHASPVNALLEACLQTPILVPVPNCSISRCRWIAEEAQSDVAPSGEGWMRSKKIQTMSDQRGWWLLDYQTHTRHLARDLR